MWSKLLPTAETIELVGKVVRCHIYSIDIHMGGQVGFFKFKSSHNHTKKIQVKSRHNHTKKFQVKSLDYE